MDAKTLKALKGSIKKWEGIVAGTGVDKGERNCPLCKLFIAWGCNGCPVAEKTGCGNCAGTPYRDFLWNSGEDGLGDSVADNPKALECAKAMLAFLKSLLPKRGNKNA